MNGRRRMALGGMVLTAACASGPPGPASLDPANERCRFCHMVVSDGRTAGQLVAPGEEPSFFDDLGCLASYLAAQKALPAASIVYVADHRTKAWVRAESALYTRRPDLDTPMSSHLIAHADATSRDADPDARGGQSVSRRELFGPVWPEATSRTRERP